MQAICYHDEYNIYILLLRRSLLTSVWVFYLIGNNTLLSLLHFCLKQKLCVNRVVRLLVYNKKNEETTDSGFNNATNKYWFNYEISHRNKSI